MFILAVVGFFAIVLAPHSRKVFTDQSATGDSVAHADGGGGDPSSSGHNCGGNCLDGSSSCND